MPLTANIKQSGFTLLEALISVVVISIGLLGILGLQAVGIASTQTSVTRSSAAMEIENMIARMRANPAAVADGDFANVDNPAAGKAPGKNCNADACTPAEMAAYDAYQWDVYLGTVLPAGRGQIECEDSPCNPTSPHTITVTWNEKDKREGEINTQSFNAVFRP